MSKRLILTGVLALCCPLVPVQADADYITNESTCDNDTLGSTESATLVAQWSPNPYTITYNCGSGISGTASTPVGPTTASLAVVMDGPYTLAAGNNCSLTGYTFAGWSCPNLPGTKTLPADAQTKLYFAGGATGTYSYAGNITCTAQWTQNSIALDWNPDNGGSHINTSCAYDGAITLPDEPSKAGYTFAGWQVVTPTPTP